MSHQIDMTISSFDDRLCSHQMSFHCFESNIRFDIDREQPQYLNIISISGLIGGKYNYRLFNSKFPTVKVRKPRC
ncbi:hypothetical protein RIR_jg2540.t1 [Rhizophagus irregularis DAOM 181602=DAOM 197198]|uniref:Uncharacterized protein n=1 Tax=Rhizophagus irregularis (strain DAOM 181602 / DAOM 197198 / MUCL 43194) TaxID=747089 RepID=U9UUR6_RHIID|nr:hypothetical protein RIR_jg2540.t1 [Rhizophagus irregularis DAOM 181602=DAOM 197198]